MDKDIARLGFIQAIITRIGTNSFLLKDWSITVVAAIFALAAKDADHRFILIAYFPVIVFGGWMVASWTKSGFFGSSMNRWQSSQ